ncbi:uncharacterized protein LOC134542114 isoform X3 [Bacillus rossius redtenbacheri]|uniref:uncharacterized protein LOC134542114 isoform X3 n=1 Tax=Bacillus rossius redtenbacheri TaxID=93214 RepID=UPI002FDCB069
MYGPISIAVGCGCGILRVSYSKREALIDIVPADVVANCIITSTITVHSNRSPDVIPVYNITMPEKNPLTVGKFSDIMLKTVREHPYKTAVWYPFCYLIQNFHVYMFLAFFLHFLPGCLLDLVLRLKGKKPIFLKIYKKLKKHSVLTQYFVNCQDWKFITENTRNLYEQLSSQDRKLFPFHLNMINWNGYLEDTVKESRKYVMYESFNDDKAKSHHQRMSVAGDTEVQGLYRDCGVLVTGATGFLGKLTIEKILRSCPGVRTVYALVRPKRGLSVDQRKKALLDDVVFDRLKRERPDSVDKIVFVAGDCSSPRLGLSDSDYHHLTQHVHIVLHLAATVRFDEHLKVAVDTNVKGTMEVIALCRDCVSLKEEFYEPPMSVENTFILLNKFTEHELTILGPKIVDPWPNPYVYSKAISENVILTQGKGLPIAIVRPSIVVSTLKEPIVGWIDNLYGPISFAVGCGCGIFRVGLSNGEALMDLVPADMVANCVIASALTGLSRSQDVMPVYNITTSENNPLTGKAFTTILLNMIHEYPFKTAVWYPYFYHIKNFYVYLFLAFFLHFLPGCLLDLVLRLKGKKPMCGVSVIMSAAGDTEVQGLYRDCGVLVTGATGFLGKLTIQKILRSCPGVRTVYALVRPKRGLSVDQRKKIVLDNVVFDHMKREQPDSVDKIVFVAGDCSSPRLGLSDSDYHHLTQHVNIVLHLAATVRFDEHLKVAVDINMKGTMEVIALCRDCVSLKAVVFVSTAYSNCPHDVVKEEFYEPPMLAEDTLAMLNKFTELELAILGPKIIYPWPNTYTFSKAISENTIFTKGNGLPIAIVRPSMVIQTLEEPIIGWIDNMYGAISIAVGIGCGILRVSYSNGDALFDTIPADLVTNCIIASALAGNSRLQDVIPIYNITTSEDNPTLLKEFCNVLDKYEKKYPFKRTVWYPFYYLIKNFYVYMSLAFFLHFLPGCLLDLVLRLKGKKPIEETVKIKQEMIQIKENLSSGKDHNATYSQVIKNSSNHKTAERVISQRDTGNRSQPRDLLNSQQESRCVMRDNDKERVDSTPFTLVEHRRKSNTRDTSDIKRSTEMKKTPMKIGILNISTLKMLPKPAPKRMKALFVTRFDPSVQEQEIVEYISSELNLDHIKVTKMKTKFNSYASFHVQVLEEDFSRINNIVFWPSGCLISPFFGKLHPEQILSNSSTTEELNTSTCNIATNSTDISKPTSAPTSALVPGGASH